MKRVLAFLVAVAPAAVSAQSDSTEAFVRAFIRRYNIPAAAVTVARHGRVVKAHGYGVANLELGVSATGHSVFEIGSITKQFSAAAVMLLVEQGKLSLDDSISRYLSVPPEWNAIRIRHLLAHTSGLHDWEGDTTFSLAREYPIDEFIAFVARHPLDFSPGSKWAYTNSAYPLIGEIIAKVSGVPYEQFVLERIIRPAGMSETRFRHAGEIVPRRASGYVERGGVLFNGAPLRPAVLSPNGFILSTAADMGKWCVALSRGAVASNASMGLMTSPVPLSDGSTVPFAGIGWFLSEYQGHRALIHNGSTAAGFSSVIYRYPNDDLCVVVLLNIDRDDKVNQLATSVASFYVRGIGARAPLK